MFPFKWLSPPMALKVVALTEMATRRARYIFCSRQMCVYMYVCMYIYRHSSWCCPSWLGYARLVLARKATWRLASAETFVQEVASSTNVLVHQYQWGGLRDNCSTPVFLHFKLRFQFKISLGFCDRICKLQNVSAWIAPKLDGCSNLQQDMVEVGKVLLKQSWAFFYDKECSPYGLHTIVLIWSWSQSWQHRCP